MQGLMPYTLAMQWRPRCDRRSTKAGAA